MRRIAAILMLLFFAAPAWAEKTYYRCAKCGQLHEVKSADAGQRVVVQKPVITPAPGSATGATTSASTATPATPAGSVRTTTTLRSQPQQIAQRSYSPFAPSEQWPIQIQPAAQAFAEREVRIMAQRGQAGHFLGMAPGATMGGVGDASGQTGNVPTCVPQPHENKVLIADATYYDARTNKTYRCRQWR